MAQAGSPFSVTFGHFEFTVFLLFNDLMEAVAEGQDDLGIWTFVAFFLLAVPPLLFCPSRADRQLPWWQ